MSTTDFHDFRLGTRCALVNSSSATSVRAAPSFTMAFGGELPFGCDPENPNPQPLEASDLAFSHGRAALAWLVAWRGPFKSALVAAYTCPQVPDLLRRLGIDVSVIDIGACDWACVARSLHGRTLIVIPALLGHAPVVGPSLLAQTVGPQALVLVDAVQTAFGHLWLNPPSGGAVLSGPRKCTGLADGAILRLDNPSEGERQSVAGLPRATEAVGFKLAGRAMMMGRSPATEDEMLALFARSEMALPDAPCRMSNHSRHQLARLDADRHAKSRWTNWQALARRLADAAHVIRLPGGVPFNLSILVENRAAVLARLKALRVFATPLWPDSRHDPVEHPEAARWAHQLVGLPIDQRYNIEDMNELAKRVLQCLHH